MSALEIYKALADESRLRLVHMLHHGYFNVQELTQVLGLGQSTVSHHLKILQQAGLTKLQKEGTWVYYTLQRDEDTLAGGLTGGFLASLGGAGNESLSAILEKDKGQLQGILNRRRDRTQRYFDSVAGKWKELRKEAQGSESHLEYLAERIPPEARLLELGCGSGALLERILPRPGITIGVDSSQAMLDEARAMLSARSLSADLRLGYLEHLPLGDGSVEHAVAYMVLHHVPNPADALRDACRVLSEGGTLQVVDLAAHNNEYMKERFADLWLGFEPGELQRTVQQCGFSQAKFEILGASGESFLLTCTK